MFFRNKRIISLLMAVVLALCYPLGVLAEQAWEEELDLGFSDILSLGLSEGYVPEYEVIPNDDMERGSVGAGMRRAARAATTTIDTLSVGTKVWLPMDNGTTIPCYIISKDSGNYTDGVVLATADIVAFLRYSDSYLYHNGGVGALAWPNSPTKHYLNENFYNQVDSKVRTYFKSTTFGEEILIQWYSESNKLTESSHSATSSANSVFVPTTYEMYQWGGGYIAAFDWNTVQGRDFYLSNRQNNQRYSYYFYIQQNWVIASGGNTYTSHSSLQSAGSDAKTNREVRPHFVLDRNTPINPEGGGDGWEIEANRPPNAPVITKNPSANSINYWTNTSIAYSWSATDPDGDALTYTAQISTDNGATWSTVQNNTAGTTYTYNIPSNVTTVALRVKASDGKEESAYTTSPATTVVRDTTKPTISHTLTPSSWTNGNVTINLTLGDTQSGLKSLTVPSGISEYPSGGSVALNGTSVSRSFTAPANASYTFTVYDNAGNTESHTVSVDKIDRVKPTISHTLAPASWTNGNVTINLTLGDTQSGLKSLTVPAGLSGYTSGGSVTLSGASDTKSFTAPANSSYTFIVYDNAGNSESHTVSVDKIDRVKPAISHTLTPNTWTNGNVVIGLTMTDANSGLKSLTVPAGLSGYASGGSVTVSGSSDSKSFTATGNGNYDFTVYDQAGNSEGLRVTVDKIDKIKPTISHTLEPADWTNGNVNIKLTLADGQSGLRSLTVPAGLSGYASGGTINLSGASSLQTLTATANGSYTFTVTDQVGNTEQLTVVVDKIDRVDPGLTIDANVKQYHNNANAILTATGTDDKAGVASFTLPGGGSTTTNPATYTITQNGAYTFTVYDKAGNSKQESYSYQWFDRTKPVIESLTFEKTGEQLNTGIFNWMRSSQVISNEQVKILLTYSDTPDGNDAESGVVSFTYSIYDTQDNELLAWTTVPISQLPTLDDEMEGYVLAYVTDAAGNRSDQGRYDILLDGTPPQLEYTTRINGYITDDGITKEKVVATITGEDLESGFSHFKVLDTEEEIQSSQMQYTYTQNGLYTFRGYDLAGNYTDLPIEIDCIDTTKPQIISLTFEKTGEGLLQRVARYFTGEQQAANEQVKIVLEASDAPELVDAEKGIYSAESGVATFTFSLWDHEGNQLRAPSTWDIDRLDEIPPIEFLMDGYILAYITDGVGHVSYGEGLYQGDRYPIILENTPPKISYAFTPPTYTRGGVTATLEGSDDESGFSHYILAGERYEGDTMQYVFEENKTETVRGYDFAGNYTEEQLVVSWIDRTPPRLDELDAEVVNPGLFERMMGRSSGAGLRILYSGSDTPEGNNAESGVDSFTYRIYDEEGEPLTEWNTVPYGEEVTLDSLFNGSILAYVTDRAGNHSYEWYGDSPEDGDGKEVTLDELPPRVSYTLSTTEYTNGNVTAYLQGHDTESGFSHFEILETGRILQGDTAEYIFRQNNTVLVRGYDKVGNYADMAVTVENIDKTPPQIVSLDFEKAGGELRPQARGILGLFRPQNNTVANEQVKIVLRAVDTPAGPDTESGVASFHYRIYFQDGSPYHEWQEVPIERVDEIPPIDFAFTGYIRAYVTDHAGNRSDGKNPAFELDCGCGGDCGCEGCEEGECNCDKDCDCGKDDEGCGCGGNCGCEGCEEGECNCDDDCSCQDKDCGCGGDCDCEDCGEDGCGCGADCGCSDDDDGDEFPIILDNTSPVLSVTYDITSYTNQPVTATLHGHDEESGFSHMVNVMTGETAHTDTLYITFDRNKSTKYIGYDDAGNISDELAVVVDWIDLTPPELLVEWDEEDREDKYSPVVFTITASDVDQGDGVSGIAGIYLPDGTTVEAESVIFTATHNGEYQFAAVDRAGNRTESEAVIISCIEERESGNPCECEDCSCPGCEEDNCTCDEDSGCGCGSGDNGGNGGDTNGGNGGGSGGGRGNDGGSGTPDTDYKLPEPVVPVAILPEDDENASGNFNNNPLTGR